MDYDLMSMAIPAVTLVVGTSLWVGFDAHKHKVAQDGSMPYNGVNVAVSWVILCLLFWIVGFPYYVYRRSVALKAQGEKH